MPPKTKKNKGKKKNYKTNYKPSVKAKKGKIGMLSIKTLQPKELFLTVSYNQVIHYTAMKQGTGQLCPSTLKVSLNNPLATKILKDVNASQANASTYTESNLSNNLREELLPYWNAHSRALVINSDCTVQYTQFLNQYKLERHLVNDDAEGNQSGDTALTWTNAHPRDMRMQEATQDGDIYVACVKTFGTIPSDQQALQQATTIYDLKNKVAGLQMRNIQCTPRTQKSVKFKMKYNPKTDLELKDLDDNHASVDFYNVAGATIPDHPPGKTCFCSTAIFNRLKPPTIPSEPYLSKLPLFKVEVRVKYNIKFFRRTNALESNDAIPHVAPPRGRADQMGE